MRGPSVAPATSGAGVLTGSYKYKAFLRRVDAQGNIIDGIAANPASITLAANAVTVSIGAGLYSNASGYLTRSCAKGSANESTAGFFYVDHGAGQAPIVQVGDPVAFLDNAGVLRRSVVTGYCATGAGYSPTMNSIKIADGTRTINVGSLISAGLTVVILRTLAGGNQYYELAEIPITGLGAATFADNISDTTLSAQAQFTDQPLGKEKNSVPSCSLVCQHQGGLVVARGFSTSNTVSFSLVDDIEFFPLASNNLDVPSTQSGYITAIASDTNDRLAVFKRRGYYDIVGDLDGGNFSVNVKNEGDYGIVSHTSIARVKDSLIGLSDNGFVVIKDGELFPNVFNDLNANLVNRPVSAFEWAVAANDSYGRVYNCSILERIGGNETLHYALDYSRGRITTFAKSYFDFTDAAGGMASLGENFYHLSQTSGCAFVRLKRFTPTGSPTRTAGDFYYQDVYTPTFYFESNVINLGQPDVLNTPVRIRIWSLPNNSSIDAWLPFTLNVRGTAATALITFDGFPVSPDTNATITFNSPGFIDVKLAQNKKTHFYIVSFTAQLAKQAPFITGYEILYAENYKAEDLVK
jgi:hypothetical protein